MTRRWPPDPRFFRVLQDPTQWDTSELWAVPAESPGAASGQHANANRCRA